MGQLPDHTIRSVIVEDEVGSQATLKKLLNQYCPEVDVAAISPTVKESITIIDEVRPQLIFLDIALPDGDGFNVLENIRHTDYRVIFVTAYDKYAIRAFEFSALHYLLKPISHIELQDAVKRFNISRDENQFDYKNRLSLLKNNLNQENQKIILPTAEGFELVKLDDIIHMEASHNYTKCFLLGGKTMLVSKPLISFENILDELQFVRVHNKHLINLMYIKKYFRGSGGTVKLIDDSEISVSKSRKTEFLQRVSQFAHHL